MQRSGSEDLVASLEAEEAERRALRMQTSTGVNMFRQYAQQAQAEAEAPLTTAESVEAKAPTPVRSASQISTANDSTHSPLVHSSPHHRPSSVNGEGGTGASTSRGERSPREVWTGMHEQSAMLKQELEKLKHDDVVNYLGERRSTLLQSLSQSPNSHW